MSKSVKLKGNTYWDSKSITHNQKLLSDILYPVGSIYMSVNSTSPATLFGGTWTQISGRFLYCTTTSKTTGGSTTTGSATGNTGSATGNTGATTLTIDQIPSHNHWLYNENAGGHSTSFAISYASKGYGYNIYTSNAGGGGSHTHTLNSHTHTLNSHTHSQNLPPYFTVYCWYRTA